MTTTIPPAHSNIATPPDWGTVTLDQAWAESDLTGVPASAILRAPHEVIGRDAQLGR